MAKKKTEAKCQCGEKCKCSFGQVVAGYRYGVGFWLAGITIWLIVSLVIALLYTLL